MFVDDAGQIFNNLIELSTLTSWIEPVRNVRYYAGLDLGRQVDYTVLIIIDEFGKVCYIYRDNQKTWSLLQHNIISVLNKYHPQLLMEINSIGDVLYEQIKKEYNIVEPFITSQKSKEELIENLIYMFNDKKIQIPSKNFYPELYNELSIFGFEYNKHTRTIKYGAPPGFHDDLIISLGLAFKAFKSKKSGKIYIERF